MLRPDEMPSQIEQITDGSVGTQKPLSLTYGLESPHPPLPHPGRLMGLLYPIILILLSTVDRLGHQLTMSNTIAAQFVGHDLSGLTTMASQ